MLSEIPQNKVTLGFLVLLTHLIVTNKHAEWIYQGCSSLPTHICPSFMSSRVCLKTECRKKKNLHTEEETTCVICRATATDEPEGDKNQSTPTLQTTLLYNHSWVQKGIDHHCAANTFVQTSFKNSLECWSCCSTKYSALWYFYLTLHWSKETSKVCFNKTHEPSFHLISLECPI